MEQGRTVGKAAVSTVDTGWLAVNFNVRVEAAFTLVGVGGNRFPADARADQDHAPAASLIQLYSSLNLQGPWAGGRHQETISPRRCSAPGAIRSPRSSAQTLRRSRPRNGRCD